MQITEKLIKTAQRCWDQWLNAIPCNNEKRPVGEWSFFQKRLITQEEFTDRINGHAYGIGIVTGEISKNLEVIDIDCKYDLDGNLADTYFDLIKDNDPDLLDSIHIVQTQSLGFHLYYRCETISGNLKLARRPATDEEKNKKFIDTYNKEIAKGSDEKKATSIAHSVSQKEVKVLIETRGQGGFIVCPPTPGYLAYQQRPIPTISVDQRNFLLDAARSLNLLEEEIKRDYSKSNFAGETLFEVTPWDDYNSRVSSHEVTSILEKHYWTKRNYSKKPRLFFTRPGKNKDTSADYHEEKKLFKVWSTSVGEFEALHAYTPSSIFKILECNGDPKEASRRLEQLGYGKRKEQPKKQAAAGIQGAVQPENPRQNLAEYDHLLITKEKQIPEDIPTITIAGGTFAAPHNISIISGPPKGAKTAITGAMIAAAVSETGGTDSFPDIKALVNTDRKAVLNFGTEQSEADEQYNLVNILKRAGLSSTPDYLRCYNIRQLDYKNYKEVTDDICRLANERFGGIHSIFIDGGADYIGSVNDEKESTDIVQYFTHLSIRYNCPVIVIVHQNPSTQKGVEKKERGHFGSHVQRKCYGLITLEKQGEIFSLQPKMLRRSGNEDMPLIQFKYSKERGYHVQVDAQDQEAASDLKRWEKLKAIAAEVFAGQASYRHKDAVARVMDHTKKGFSTAKKMLNDMVGFQFVDHQGDFYRLNRSKVNVGQS